MTVICNGLSGLERTTYLLGWDQCGTIKAVCTPSGHLVKKVLYDSFGNVLHDSNPAFVLPLGFAGGLVDPHTGFVRFGHRDYDPEVGRFTDRDPLGDTGGDHDLYEYCVDDPINKVDPNGLFLDKWWKNTKGFIQGFFNGKGEIDKASSTGEFIKDAAMAAQNATTFDEQAKKSGKMINTNPDQALYEIEKTQQMQIDRIKNILRGPVSSGANMQK